MLEIPEIRTITQKKKPLSQREMSCPPLFPVSFISPRVPGGFVFSLLDLRASVANFLPLILCLSALIATTIALTKGPNVHWMI